MKKLALRPIVLVLSLVVTGLGVVNVAHGGGKHKKPTQLTGRIVEYKFADYHLRVEFQNENQLQWTYLSAPTDQTGKTGVEKVERRDVRPSVVLMAWTEADGSNIVEI